jgi:hypothetical protein
LARVSPRTRAVGGEHRSDMKAMDEFYI